ncbi:hypothetical protein [Lewinella sp. IMCC34191]|uniref:hypothetical protein n=1 Tax=Lewinella sp. IMCC34191 TaxID=2259172 RepID=UPI000E24045B|nr:hypothetical protein [Lewinella sp. IMCC34191]
MYKVRHQVYATLEGNRLDTVIERLPGLSGVGRYKNADHPGIRYPERAQLHLPEPRNDYTDIIALIDSLEKHSPVLREAGVKRMILRWTILSNDPAHEVNTELGAGELLRLANLHASLAVSFYAKAHI